MSARRLPNDGKREFVAAIHAALEGKAPRSERAALAELLWLIVGLWRHHDSGDTEAARRAIGTALRDVTKAEAALAAPSLTLLLLLSQADAPLTTGQQRGDRGHAATADALRRVRLQLERAAELAAYCRPLNLAGDYLRMAAAVYVRDMLRQAALPTATRGGPFHACMIAVKRAATGRGLRWSDFLALPRL